MAYLTYEEYTEFGGKLSESAFSNMERRAEKKLNYLTQNRIKYLTVIPEEVKELMTVFVDKLSDMDKAGSVTSYSNGTESFSYGNRTSEQIQGEFWQLAKEYLDTDLVSMVVDADGD